MTLFRAARRLIHATGRAGVLLCLLASLRPAAAADLQHVQLGSAAAVATYAAPYIALTKGYYKEQGLDVSILNFPGGSKALEALMGGSVDAMIGSYSNAILMAAKGQHVETFINYLRCPGYVVAVGKNHPAKTLADMKGMTIGITAPGSSTQQTLNYLMVRAGLSVNDYTPVGIGNGAGAVAAVHYGKVDGLIMVEPIISLLENAGDVTDVLDMRSEKASVAAMGGPYPEGSLLARTEYIHAHPQIIQGLTDAVMKAIRWIQQATPDEIAKALPHEIVGDHEPLIAASIAKIRGCYSPDGVIQAGGPQTVLNMLTTYDPALKADHIDLSQTYTNVFVEKATAK